MLGGMAALWLFNVAVLLLCLWVLPPDFEQAGWQCWLVILLFQAVCTGIFLLLSRKVLRWQKRKNQRHSPEIKAERARIAQDLHDGVGAHLFQALALLEAPTPTLQDVRHSIENAMWCLRVEMESLDDVDASLVERLAMMRWRLQPLLQARGVCMVWQMPMDERDISPHGERGLQLAMLAQEAISNALRHAQCKALQVTLNCNGAQWHLEIADDGRGYQPVATDHCPAPATVLGKGQRGLQSMYRRAKQASAVLSINAQTGRGTCIDVQWNAVT